MPPTWKFQTLVVATWLVKSFNESHLLIKRKSSSSKLFSPFNKNILQTTNLWTGDQDWSVIAAQYHSWTFQFFLKMTSVGISSPLCKNFAPQAGICSCRSLSKRYTQTYSWPGMRKINNIFESIQFEKYQHIPKSNFFNFKSLAADRSYWHATNVCISWHD